MLLPKNIEYTQKTIEKLNEMSKQYYSDLEDILLNNTLIFNKNEDL